MGATGWEAVDRALARLMASERGARAMRRPPVHAALSLGNAGLRRARGAARGARPRQRRLAASNPSNPTLGIAMMAQDCADDLRGALSAELLAVADDVVVLDGGSRDDTVAVARSLGARVIHAPWPGSFGEQETRAAHSVTTDWVFILDSDEVAGATMPEALRELIRTRRRTGWWLPRRWLVPVGDGLVQLAGRPHWPDLQARLARVVPGLRYAGSIHPSPSSATPGSWGVATAEASLLHLDLVLHDRAARERKVAARSGTFGFTGTEGFYLWEDHVRRIGPLPPSDEVIARAALARIRAGARPAV